MKSNIEAKYHKTREILKDKLNMSFKRINPRPRCYANRLINTERCLFSNKFANIIDTNHLIVNMKGILLEENDELIILEDSRQIILSAKT